ncbi:MAG: hypothetical protein IPP67_03375 [Rhodospirillaceae bacterium]|nr:hypothetical protein [Rhodospirillaceae bacterium]
MVQPRKSGAAWLQRLFGPQQSMAVAEAYQHCLDPNQARSKMILADLAVYCQVRHTSFTANDPHQTAFNEGARDVFLHIMEMLGLTADDFIQLQRNYEV